MPDLQIRIVRASPVDVQTPLLLLLKFERDMEPEGPAHEVDERLGGEVGRVLGRGDFQGRVEETLLLYPRGGEIPAERVLLVGIGKREDFTIETLRRAIGAGIRLAEGRAIPGIAVDLGVREKIGEQMGAYHAARAVAEGAVLASWRFLELKSAPGEKDPRGEVESVELIARSDEEEAAFARGIRDGGTVARAENFARELAARPGNVATPTYLAETAQRIASEAGLSCRVLDRGGIEDERMGALLAVARGSDEEPRFIILEHAGGNADAAPLVLVGKGVTFDSGGISIKPSASMENMKYDMSGAAAVMGAMKAIAELELQVRVVGLIPATENLPSGRALKPGDVVRTRSGKSVEVVNTDAEGRLILADALDFALQYDPAAILDAATLTGAAVIALGHEAIALMGNDGRLLDEVRAAGHRSGERCWPLPLWDEYRRQIDSDIADIKNSGGRPAGTITAAWLLKEFVGETPWAHLDIAGTAYKDEVPSYLRKGATGVPTRLFVEWVRTRAER